MNLAVGTALVGQLRLKQKRAAVLALVDETAGIVVFDEVIRSVRSTFEEAIAVAPICEPAQRRRFADESSSASFRLQHGRLPTNLFTYANL